MKNLLVSAVAAIIGCGGSTATSPPVNTRAIVVFDGNSLLATEYGEPAWPDIVMTALASPSVSSANIGVGGQTTGAMLADVRAQTDPLFGANESDVYVAWEVTNDLFFGASADSAYDRIVQLAHDQRAHGWRVVVMTPMPRGNATDPVDWEARRQIVLTRMRTNWRQFADELVDVAADSLMGSYASLDNKALFRDRVHLGPDGTQRVAAMVEPAVRRQVTRPP